MRTELMPHFPGALARLLMCLDVNFFDDTLKDTIKSLPLSVTLSGEIARRATLELVRT